MNNIDFRRHYILMIDTETANGLNDPLLYDLGCAVVDTHGNVYETASFVNKDIFKGCADLMQSAYYANKIPQYWETNLVGRTQDGYSFPDSTGGLGTDEKVSYHRCLCPQCTV